MTAVDRPDNGQDEGRWTVSDLCAELTGETVVTDGRRVVGYFHRPEDAERAVTAVNTRRAGAGEQQREQVARWLADHYGEPPVRALDPWRADAAALLDLLALLGGPQPDGEVRQHRMDADCWCRPVQADNGAWDHR